MLTLHDIRDDKRPVCLLGVYISLVSQWEPVQFFNNKIICDMVEEKHRGIISVLVQKPQ